jgi:hypothetical protein
VVGLLMFAQGLAVIGQRHDDRAVTRAVTQV